MFCFSVKKFIFLVCLSSALSSTPYLRRSKKEKENPIVFSWIKKEKKKKALARKFKWRKVWFVNVPEVSALIKTKVLLTWFPLKFTLVLCIKKDNRWGWFCSTLQTETSLGREHRVNSHLGAVSLQMHCVSLWSLPGAALALPAVVRIQCQAPDL